jgi:predicted transport protein
MIFEIKKGKATKINPKEFKNELELHQLIDKNLEELFEIRYIKDEHVTDKHGRIETLGLDSSNRPVVIEYKKSMEKGQLAQANRYVAWIKQNPDSFELLVHKNLGTIGDIDFSNIRIICFAQEYNMDDKCLAPVLSAELWKYTYYENDTLVIVREEEPDQLIKNSKPKTYTVSKNQVESKTKKEIRKPKSIDEHLEGASKELISLYEKLDYKVAEISSEIERYTTYNEILYKTSVNFIALSIQKKNNRLRFLLRTKDNQINDPKKLTEIIPKNYGWGNMNRILYVDPKEFGKKYNMADILDLIIQSYKMTK